MPSRGRKRFVSEGDGGLIKDSSFWWLQWFKYFVGKYLPFIVSASFSCCVQQVQVFNSVSNDCWVLLPSKFKTAHTRFWILLSLLAMVNFSTTVYERLSKQICLLKSLKILQLYHAKTQINPSCENLIILTNDWHSWISNYQKSSQLYQMSPTKKYRNSGLYVLVIKVLLLNFEAFYVKCLVSDMDEIVRLTMCQMWFYYLLNIIVLENAVSRLCQKIKFYQTEICFFILHFVWCWPELLFSMWHWSN